MSRVAQEIQDLEYGDRVAELELALERSKARAAAKASALRMASRRLEQLEQHISLNEALLTATPRPPTWLTPKRALKTGHATVCAMLSDTHFDEVINPREVNGLNAYNRAIAEDRIKRYFEKVIEIPKHHFSGMQYDGVVIFLGGDMLSGDIHEELTQTNEDTILASCLHWSEQLAAGIGMLAGAYDNVHVASVCGNHPRRSRKERGKMRARDNFDWLLAHMTQRAVQAENVTWQIPEEVDCRVQVLETRYLLTHGNLGFGGGGGIAGAWTPIVRGDLKRRQREGAAGDAYDVLLVGHWHTLRFGGEFVINGCFVPGTAVCTPSGPVRIADVRVGDEVLSRDGTSQKVENIFTKTVDRTVAIKVKGLPRPIEGTANHAVWAAKGTTNSAPPSRRHLQGSEHGPAEWIPLGHIGPGDFVHVPFPQGSAEPIDRETAWAYGLYLAEGHATAAGGARGTINRVHITMNVKQREHVERWATWFERTYHRTPRVFHRKGRNTTDLYVHVTNELAVWFQEFFGHGAHNKHLPAGAYSWSDELKTAIVEGWVTGDGHEAIRPDCRPTISASTASPRLAWGMFHLAPATGYWPSLSTLPAGGRRKRDSWAVHFNVGQDVKVIDGEAFFRVSERYERSGGEVHDLQVTGEHTYVVEGMGVHNSTKGIDEYAYSRSFGLEAPKQALWLETPSYGPFGYTPIFCAPMLPDGRIDRKKEGW